MIILEPRHEKIYCCLFAYAYMRLCFRYIDSTIPLLSSSEMSSPFFVSDLVRKPVSTVCLMTRPISDQSNYGCRFQPPSSIICVVSNRWKPMYWHVFLQPLHVRAFACSAASRENESHVFTKIHCFFCSSSYSFTLKLDNTK